MPSRDPISTATTPSPSSDKKVITGPAPKALEEDFGGLGEDGMPLHPTGGDPTVQFISGQDPANGEAKIEISEGTPNFVGLGKEELMRYANDPFWIKLRWFLFILFWILWVAMLAGAVIIIILAPKCSDKKSEPDTYYQVYVKSFANDGKLADLESRAKYLTDLGVKTIIISQVLHTETGAGTQNVIDFKEIDPVFGTMDIFKNTVSALKKQGLNVLLQLIPNHSGVKHKWFTENSTEQYYVRRPATNVSESTWKTVEGKNAWQEDTLDSADMYLRQFGELEADLNYNNPQVIKEMKGVLDFWISKGVDGFLLSDVSYLVEDLTKLKDQSATKNQPQNVDVIKSITESIKDKIVLLDTDNLDIGSDEFKDLSASNALPVVTDLSTKLSKSSNADNVLDVVNNIVDSNITNLVLRLSGPRIDRIEKKLESRDRANLVAMVALSLKSKVILYYGDEVGDLTDTTEIVNSGPEKGTQKMKWPMSESQNNTLKYFKSLIEHQRLINAESKDKPTQYKSVNGTFTIIRESEACTYVIATNFDSNPVVLNFHDVNLLSSTKWEILVHTPNNKPKEGDGTTVTEGKLEIAANGGVIVKST